MLMCISAYLIVTVTLENVENFTEKVEFTTNNAGNTIFTYMYVRSTLIVSMSKMYILIKVLKY